MTKQQVEAIVSAIRIIAETVVADAKRDPDCSYSETVSTCDEQEELLYKEFNIK
jgi:hypothetical protein